MAVLIDTSVLVAVERGNMTEDEVADWVGVGKGHSISVVTVAELLHGVHGASGRRAQARSAYIEALLGIFEPVPVTTQVARAFGLAAADLSRRGTPVDANDLWIAATAIAHGLSVATLDGDFHRVPGVSVLPAPR